MHIQSLGHSCFKLTGKDDKGNAVSLVTDPFGPEYGLRLPNVEADIITVSHQHKDHNNVSGVKGKPYVIDTPGEYEVRDVFIQGIDSFHDDKSGGERGTNIIYRISMEDMVVTHLGDLGHILDAKQLERLEGTDILFIPVGGVYTLNAQKAVEVINQIEPRLVIPMHYKVSGLKIELEVLDKFIKEIGMKPREEEKLKINKKDLPLEDMDFVVLKS